MKLWTDEEISVCNSTSATEQVKASFLVLQAAAAGASTTNTRGNPMHLCCVHLSLQTLRYIEAIVLNCPSK